MIPSLVPHAGQEGSGGSCVCTTSVFTQLSRSAFLPELKPNREPTNTWTVICGARQLSYVHSESFLLDLRSSRSAQLSVNKQLIKPQLQALLWLVDLLMGSVAFCHRGICSNPASASSE